MIWSDGCTHSPLQPMRTANALWRYAHVRLLDGAEKKEANYAACPVVGLPPWILHIVIAFPVSSHPYNSHALFTIPSYRGPIPGYTTRGIGMPDSAQSDERRGAGLIQFQTSLVSGQVSFLSEGVPAKARIAIDLLPYPSDRGPLATYPGNHHPLAASA
jgi:hypothetical protein